MDATTNNSRQTNGFKHCSNTFLTYRGVLYQQWSDCSSKEDAKEVVERSEIENPMKKFMIRKRENFYRVYFTEFKKPE